MTGFEITKLQGLYRQDFTYNSTRFTVLATQCLPINACRRVWMLWARHLGNVPAAETAYSMIPLDRLMVRLGGPA